MSVDDLKSEALALPPSLRAELVETIQRSLEPSDHDEAWQAEAESRLTAVRSGDLATDDGKTTLQSARGLLPSE